tara:strand:+ start:267 stop:419 length:153 start_codon:yes stop_codon:yes gene_type:complete
MSETTNDNISNNNYDNIETLLKDKDELTNKEQQYLIKEFIKLSYLNHIPY